MFIFISVLVVTGIFVFLFVNDQHKTIRALIGPFAAAVLVLFIFNMLLSQLTGFSKSTEKGVVTSIEYGTATIEVDNEDGYKYFEADTTDYYNLESGDEVTLEVTTAGVLERVNLSTENMLSGVTPQFQTAKIISHDINFFSKVYRSFTN